MVRSRAATYSGRLRIGLAVLGVLALAGCNQLMTAGTPPEAALGPQPQAVPAATGAGAEEHARIVAAYEGLPQKPATKRT